MRFLYAHGFASGPQSSKAEALRKALAARSRQLEIPALDEDDFEHLTISGQLSVVERTLRNSAARLIGSSMGGYLAALYASAHPEADRIVLMAPAFGFASRWAEKTAPGDPIEIFHYGDRTTRRVHYGLIEDALRYPAVPAFSQPALIFHGVGDDIVPVEYSRRFAAGHPNARLIELDSDHQLLDALDEIIAQALPFLLAERLR